MVKVLTILSGLDGGGIETILLNYLKCFDLNKINMDVIVHSPDIGFLEEEYKKLGCNIYRVTPKHISIYKNYREIKNIIKEGNYDIVHSRMNYKGFTQIMAAFICGVPVRIIHNHQANMEKNFPMYKKLAIRILRKITILLSTDYMACSDVAAIDMFGRRMVQKNQVTILKNALNLDKYKLNSSIRETYRKNLGLGSSDIVIGMVGRFHPQKNHDFMLKVFEEIIKRDNRYILLLVGGGENLEKYKQIVKSNDSIKGKVIFTGIRNDVPNLLQAMDMFVLPSKYEGFGNVFIESQASGLLTIASDAVPKETKLTDCIIYLSLEKGPEYWANFIISKNIDIINRKNKFNELRSAGFDIEEQASFLQKKYLNTKGSIFKIF